MFLVQDPKYLIAHDKPTPGANPGNYGPATPGTTHGTDYTDPDPASTQKIVDAQNSLVENLAEAYRLMGEVVAVLNNAAQNYVHADRAMFVWNTTT
jgi:hypothetical protein